MKLISTLTLFCAIVLGIPVGNSPAKASDPFINLPTLMEFAFLLQFTNIEALKSPSIFTKPVDYANDNLVIRLKDRDASKTRWMECADVELIPFSELVEFINDPRDFRPSLIADTVISTTAYNSFPLFGITSIRTSVGVFSKDFDIDNVMSKAEKSPSDAFFTNDTIAQLNKVTSRGFNYLLGERLNRIRFSVRETECDDGIKIYHVHGTKRLF